MSRYLEHVAAALFAVLLTTTSFVTVVAMPEAPAPHVAAALA